ncbi:MAG: hypothetical protein ABSD30_01060 [Candidatus Binatus sp.]|jgi:hypothetical protein
MKQEKIYDFAIDYPLTPTRRKAVEKHIVLNARLFPRPVTYNWADDDGEVLHIAAEPVQIEVRFQETKVELYAAAPLWARLLFTNKKKAELKDQIESILQKAKFVAVRKPKTRAAASRRKSPPPARRKRSNA